MKLKEQNGHREPVHFLLFSASLRKGSLNTKLINVVSNIIKKNGGYVDVASMNDFDGPSFNQDLESQGVVPDGPKEFYERVKANDAFIISSPEYNGSMPGLLKNAIDWVSRFRPQPFNERHALLMSASPSMAGGNRGLWSLRIPFERLGTRVFPDMFSLAMAHKAFNTDGQLNDAALANQFEAIVVAFMNLAEAAKHYPCMKKAWVEFPGEKIDAVTERVE